MPPSDGPRRRRRDRDRERDRERDQRRADLRELELDAHVDPRGLLDPPTVDELDELDVDDELERKLASFDVLLGDDGE